ncbi:oligopeptide:H+ symporter [Thiotrichales bacterium 19S3-7]|nr:oligopeptide:H+ symporter [Thiotrichales bacterium 19S3-7]MCF6801135.1 oligopeptide:H+ symporter [Thiotrichales bacterium 19S3-11]
MTSITSNHLKPELTNQTESKSFPLPFWIVWSIEFWERFGFYGVQAILALYMSNDLGYTSTESMIIFGSFSAFCYGFVWIGGLIGDQYLGAKRTILIGGIVLMLSYALLAFADKSTFFYALSGIIVGNALFKANPSSLISKLYKRDDPRLDGAMTLYYFAINIGGFISVLFTPALPYKDAFLLCCIGLIIGITTFSFMINKLHHVATRADLKPFSLIKLINVLIGSIFCIILIAQLLNHSYLVTSLAFIVSGLCFIYFIIKAFGYDKAERNRMLIALILIIQAVLFFALYQQMPTSLTFFAEHNVIRQFENYTIPAAYFYNLDPLFIMLMSPVLAYFYKKSPSTHVTKFCLGMSLCAFGFLILWFAKFNAYNGMVSSLFLVISYWLQATGELFISALGLAMVASLCPKKMSGFVMGLWFVSVMLAGPIGAWLGELTQPALHQHLTTLESLSLYSNAFGEIGLITLAVSLSMWLLRPLLNHYL